MTSSTGGSIIERAARLGFLAGLVLLISGWGGSVPQARKEAAKFILEKLEQQKGEAWDRVLKEFLWDYRFDHDNCELTVRRISSYGDNFIATIPVAEAIPYWHHDSSLTFYCQDSNDCISERLESPTIDSDEKQVGQAKLMAPNPNDLPKLADAFTELHRLCDDAYRPADKDDATAGTPVQPVRTGTVPYLAPLPHR